MRYALFSLVAWFTLSLVGTTAPPVVPPDFAQPQSPPKPAPFPIKYIDQGQFDPRLKGYTTPEGFKLEIVATDPVIINPVGMTFAPDGTLFVLEWAPDPYSDGRWFEFKETFRYRDGTTKQVATMKKFINDPFKQLTYNAAKGIYESAKVIITDELPSTVVYHDGWLYTASRGTVRRYRQSLPNGLWDMKETIAQGFCGFHHHQVSGLTFGNDGKLYITSGDDDNFAEGSDGSRATVMRAGAVFRCNPDGTQLETFSQGYRNPYRDLAHDDKFNWFHTDNDNEDGSKFTGCRIMHVAEDTDFGWRLKTGARCCRPDSIRGAVAGELPGKVAPMIKTGRGSPAGLLIYNDTRLPAHYRGLLSYPDVYRKTIRSYRVKPNGSTFDIDAEFELLKSEDPLFRPCQMVTGPDGAIYICDWRTDSGGAGKLWGDGKNGRIYRMKWVGTKEHPEIPLRGMNSWAKLTKASNDELVRKLSSEDFSDRLIARDELVRRGETSRSVVLRKIVSGTIEPSGRLPALGVLQAFWNSDVEDLFRLLINDESADVRRLAIEGLGLRAKPKDVRIHETLVRAMTDSDPAVRRAAILAVGRIGADAAPNAVVQAWASHARATDGKDAFLTDAYLRSIERLGQPGIDALIKAAETGDNILRDKVAIAFTGMRTRPAADALAKLLTANYFTPGQRADLVRSYANYLFDPAMSLEPLAAYMVIRPTESAAVKIAALEVLGATGNLTSENGNALVMTSLDSTDAEVRSAAVRAVEESRLGSALPKLLAYAADASKTADDRAAALRAIRVTGNATAVKPLLDLIASNEVTALRLEALRTLSAIDLTQSRSIAEKWLDLKDNVLVTEAVAILGATKEGAKLIGERFVAKKLPREMWPSVSESLRKFIADPAILKLNMDVMKGGLLLSTAPADIVKVRELVATKGDPKKGKEIYLNSKVLACVSCHKMEGSGGQVGPDLTRLWDTHSIEKIMESIVQPSKEIKEGYQAYRLSTTAGQVYVGLKVSENATEVVIREASGKDIRVPKGDIDELSTSKVSLMPDDVISQITYDQFIDLIAFLKSKSEQESMRVVVAVKPEIVKPVVVKPEIVKPVIVKPVIVKPTVKPVVEKPEVVKPKIDKPGM